MSKRVITIEVEDDEILVALAGIQQAFVLIEEYLKEQGV